MDAAAQVVKHLTQHLLPQLPHSLSAALNHRCKIRPDDPRQPPEEIQFQSLQYMTMISESDRGIVYIRSYYDMREEPPMPRPTKPAPSSAAAAAAATPTSGSTSGACKTVTKLSLSDYNKQRKTSHSPRPIDAPSRIRERDPPRPDGSTKEDRNKSEATKEDTAKSSSSNSSNNRINNSNSNSNSVPATQRPRNGSATEHGSSRKPPDPLDKRKRAAADAEDERRPVKRARLEFNALAERSRTSRNDAPQRNGHKPSSGSLLPNGSGRVSAKDASHSHFHTPRNNRSPVNRPRGSSANGHQASASRPVPKNAAASNPLLPPLMSPVHLPPHIEDAAKKEKSRKDDKDTKRDDAADASRAPKLKKADPTVMATSTTQKRPKSPLLLRPPPLLSPTLPAVVESGLERLTKEKDRDGDIKTTSSKRLPGDTTPQTDRMLVTIKIPKKLSKHPLIQRFMQQLREGKGGGKEKYKEKDKEKDTEKERRKEGKEKEMEKENQAQNETQNDNEKENDRAQDRNRSRDLIDRDGLDTAGAPSTQARKRPITSDTRQETVATVAFKRPRTTSDSLPPAPRLAAPSTPAKATAMSRIPSNTSQPHTPADPNAMTPRAVPPSAERLATNGSVAKGYFLLHEKSTKYQAIGRKIKHKRDAIRGKGANDSKQLSETDKKLVAVLVIECVLAYMIGIRAHVECEVQRKRHPAPGVWTSILDYIQPSWHETSAFPVVRTLLGQLSALCHEERIRCCHAAPENWSSSEGSRDPTASTATDLVRFEKARTIAWRAAQENLCSLVIKDTRPQMRIDGIGPWTTVDEVAGKSLRVIKRWTTDENVVWEPSFDIPAMANGA